MSDVTQPGGGGAQQAYGVDPNRIHELEWSPSDIDIRHRYAFSLNYELPFGPRRRPGRRGRCSATGRSTSWPTGRAACRSPSSTPPLAATPAPARTVRTRPAPAARRPDHQPVVRHRRASSARRSTPSATPAATTSTARRSAAPTCRSSRTSSSAPSGCSCGWRCSTSPTPPSFAVPDGGLGSATFGRITSTGNNIPRQFQFAAKYLF